MARPFVICPLEHERRVLERLLGDRASFRVSGPGPDAIRRALGAILEERPPLVILAGVAGGLRECDSLAPPIDCIVDRRGGRWTPNVLDPECSQGVTLVGVEAPVVDPVAKRQLADETGAALVDCESHAFAAMLENRDVPWAVVRGVSDGPDDELPPDIDRWVDDRGRTRGLVLARRLALAPGLIPRMRALGARSRTALEEAGERITRILDRAEATP